jgi:hypothetical protein
MKQIIGLIAAFAVTGGMQMATAHAGDINVNGNLTVTNSTLTSKVGINTLTPSATLDVRPIVNAAGQSGGVKLATTDGHWPSGMFLRMDGSGIPRLAFDVNSQELMCLNQNTANVGIGTTYPTQGHLEVVSAGETNSIYAALSLDGSGTVGAAAVEGIYTANGTYGALGVAYYPNGEFPTYYGVYGYSSSGDAGYFDGAVGVSGELDGNTASFSNLRIGGGLTSAPLQIEQSQAYANLISDSTANGSVLLLQNNSASPTYLGAINFATVSSTPGQIGYESDDAFHFRTGGVADRMKLNASGLYVNGTFVSSSDRNAKENFQPVSPLAILQKVVALPVSRWNYKADSTSDHIGPMAQDFYAAFNVGPDDKHIATVDEEGVALAAIQGLNQELEAQAAQAREKDAQIQELKQRLEQLERLVNAKIIDVK